VRSDVAQRSSEETSSLCLALVGSVHCAIGHVAEESGESVVTSIEIVDSIREQQAEVSLVPENVLVTFDLVCLQARLGEGLELDEITQRRYD
jgi:hypothetical protein